MQPIRTNVLAKPYPPDEISEGGIFVPESARSESNKMLIMAVGNGTKDRPMKFKKGQTIYRVKNWGTPIDIEGERHYLMDQDSILAVE